MTEFHKKKPYLPNVCVVPSWPWYESAEFCVAQGLATNSMFLVLPLTFS